MHVQVAARDALGQELERADQQRGHGAGDMQCQRASVGDVHRALVFDVHLGVECQIARGV
jgi:hypothetical protein